jgi:hypothetical protein
MTLRLYKSALFEECARRDVGGIPHVDGYRLDRDTGARVGRRLTVPAAHVTLTGNDALCLHISQLSESDLLDFVLAHPDYLSDSYYAAFADAITARHAALVALRP